MEEVRSFEKGVNLDAALDAQPSGTVRDLLNFRVANVEGQGYILSSIAGTEEAFSLTAGFIPLGHAAYNGIAYIFSYNPDTGVGEVGTFPSPNYNGTTGFVPVYKPLQNWTSINDPRTEPPPAREDFRTTLFGFSCDHQLEVEARLSYDNSVDLFFTDFRNPLRKLNSGFDHRSGSQTGQVYWIGSFPSQVDVFFESDKHPVLEDVVVTSGGLLQAGNWFVYGRYVKTDLNPTSFLLEVGPVQISEDDPSTEGVTTGGQESLANSGRQMTLLLSNVDGNFPFMQFAIVYYHGTTVESRLVTRLYDIPVGGGQVNFTIRGDETLADITVAEIIREKSTADCVKSITQHKQRLWGGNWKESEVDYEALEDAAQQLLTRPPLPIELLELDDQAFHKISATDAYQYKDYRNTLNHAGYFRGEPYAFAVQFVLKSGKVTVPYPVKGYDAWGTPVPAPADFNTNGVFRFPAVTQDGADYSLTSGDTESNDAKVRVMGIKFEPLIPWAAMPQWIQDNVIGFYLMRAERKPQLVYQAVVTNTYSGNADFNTMRDNLFDLIETPPFPPPASISISPYCIPHFDISTGNSTPETDMLFPSRTDVNPSPDDNVNEVKVPRQPGRFGFFSTDHFFKKVFQDGQYYVQVLGDARFTYLDSTASGAARFPFMNTWQRSFARISSPLSITDFHQWEMVNVAPRSLTPISGFASKFTEGNMGEYPTAPPSMFVLEHNDGIGANDEAGNRDMAQRTYIGGTVDDASAAAAAVLHTSADTINDIRLVNIYRTPPDDVQGAAIATLYDPGFELYYRISEFIPVNDSSSGIPINRWDGLYGETFYRGDCFLQRCYTKVLSDTGYHDTSEATANATFYAYGQVLGVVQECAVNSAMRYLEGAALSDRQYTPGLGWEAFALGLPADGNDVPEMDDRNEGYDKTLGVKSRLGNDTAVPYRGERYPVRVKYSAPYIPGSTVDGYLQWDLAAERDYLHSYGEITRVHSLQNLLVIQENAIIAPYTNEQAAISPSEDSARIVLGDGDVLSENHQLVAMVGTQHQWSCIHTKAGIIGYDQQQRSFWLFNGQFMRLESALGYTAKAFELSQIVSNQSDIRFRYADRPVCSEGVVAWEDTRHKEFGWTFGINTQRSDPPDDPIMQFETIAFNYQVNAWTGRRSHTSPYYLTLNSDLYSVNPATMPWTPGVQSPYQAAFWLHDAEVTDHSTFYGTLYEAICSPVFNAGPKHPKLFDSVAVSCIDVPLKEVLFQTNFQSSILPFNTIDIGLIPRYKETRWHFPVPKATAVVAAGVNELQVKSPLRGRWMRLDLKWETTDKVHVEFISAMHRMSMQ